MTAAVTAASQQLSRSGEVPWASHTGSKYPVRESLTSIWFLCVMVQGPHQIWRVVGTPSPPPSPSSFFQEHVPKMDSFANVPRQQGAFTRLPCSVFQEHVPKMDSFANVLDSKELSSISRSKLNQHDWFSSISRFKTESKWLVFQYFQVPNWLKWLVFQYFPNPD